MFTIFAASNKLRGGEIRLFAAGFFYACTLLTIYGFVPPSGALMRPEPLRCWTTGKAKPFFFAKQTNLPVMSNTEKDCLNVKNSTVPATSAHETCTQFIAYIKANYPQLRGIRYRNRFRQHVFRAYFGKRSLYAYSCSPSRAADRFMEEMQSKVFN